MTYEEMIEQLITSGDIEEGEKINLVYYYDLPVPTDWIIHEVVGIAYNSDTDIVTIVVIATED